MLKSHKKTILETLGRNPIHPFPARMAPGIALDAIGERQDEGAAGEPLLDGGKAVVGEGLQLAGRGGRRAEQREREQPGAHHGFATASTRSPSAAAFHTTSACLASTSGSA